MIKILRSQSGSQSQFEEMNWRHVVQPFRLFQSIECNLVIFGCKLRRLITTWMIEKWFVASCHWCFSTCIPLLMSPGNHQEIHTWRSTHQQRKCHFCLWIAESVQKCDVVDQIKEVMISQPWNYCAIACSCRWANGKWEGVYRRPDKWFFTGLFLKI